jgi:hypothetical protein
MLLSSKLIYNGQLPLYLTILTDHYQDKYLLMKFLTCLANALFLLFIPGFAFSANVPEYTRLDLTNSTVGYIALGVFALAYTLVIFVRAITFT